MNHDPQLQSGVVPSAAARFFMLAADPFCLLDAAGRFIAVNPAFAALVGVPEPDLVGRPLRDLVHAEDLATLEAAWRELRPGGPAGVLRARLRCRVARCALEFSLSMDPEEGAVYSVARECHENVRLTESEQLLTTLIDALPDIISFKDGQGRWLLANPAMIRAFDLEGVDYYGKRDVELALFRPFFHESFRCCESTDEAAWAAAVTTKAEERIPQPDGSVLVFETFKVPLFNPDGSRKGLVVIGRDVAERRRMEEERAQLITSEQAALAEVRAARELDALKNAFVNSVSHELRTPLTSIRGYAEFLIDGIGGPLSIEQSDFALQIEKGAKRLERLIDDLLDFARIEAGTLSLRFQEGSLNEGVEEVMASLQPLAMEARLVMGTELSPDVPRLPFDSRRIEQVLLNLVGNAIKFTPPAGTITVATRRVGDRVRCEVRDTGVGIAPEELPKLFLRFSQLSEGLNKGVGTGLGLSISKSIIEAHGGAMGVDSRLGRGSTFWFELPLRQDR
ncbi:MAG TPA: PAS domain-containing sensor histidine kinase [Stenomitos sp.]